MRPWPFVTAMLESYLSINLLGIQRRVLHVGDGRFRSGWGGESLLDSMYTLVADAVTGGRLSMPRVRRDISPDGCTAAILPATRRTREEHLHEPALDRAVSTAATATQSIGGTLWGKSTRTR